MLPGMTILAQRASDRRLAKSSSSNAPFWRLTRDSVTRLAKSSSSNAQQLTRDSGPPWLG